MDNYICMFVFESKPHVAEAESDVDSPYIVDDSMYNIHEECLPGCHVDNHSRSPPVDVPVPDWFSQYLKLYNEDELVTSPDEVIGSFLERYKNIPVDKRNLYKGKSGRVRWTNWFINTCVKETVNNGSAPAPSDIPAEHNNVPLVIPGWEVPVVAKQQGTPIHVHSPCTRRRRRAH